MLVVSVPDGGRRLLLSWIFFNKNIRQYCSHLSLLSVLCFSQFLHPKGMISGAVYKSLKYFYGAFKSRCPYLAMHTI